MIDVSAKRFAFYLREQVSFEEWFQMQSDDRELVRKRPIALDIIERRVFVAPFRKKKGEALSSLGSIMVARALLRIVEVEIEETIPRILEFFETAEGDITETAIEKGVRSKAIVVSKAIRRMLKDGRLERTGRGRRGSPFLYSRAASIFDENATPNTPRHVTMSFSSLSREENSDPGKLLGAVTESADSIQRSERPKEIQFPEQRESNGNRMGIETEEKNTKTLRELKNAQAIERLREATSSTKRCQCRFAF